jgi:acetyl-CoA C-acetyltransferase
VDEEMIALNRHRKLARGVSMVGVGVAQFGAFPTKTTRDIFSESIQDLLNRSEYGLNIGEIQCGYIGNFSADRFEGQAHLGSILADWIGLTPTPFTRVENGCASGGSAIREGVMAIASGLYDIVLVGGVEKMTSVPTIQAIDNLAAVADSLYEVPAGFTFPGIYALVAKAHMDRYETNLEHLMKVSIKNHHNGSLNPKAQFNMPLQDLMQQRIDWAKDKGAVIPHWNNEYEFLNDLSANPWIAWPLKLFDCAPITDGAACALLVSSDLARNFTDTPVNIIGIGQATGRPLHDAEELTSFGATRFAASQAYNMAGINANQIQLAEVHDCFTIAEIVAMEDLGFFAPGEASRALDDGRTSLNGELPINTSGGLKAKGHPVGASGVAQAAEVFLQLSGKAESRQVQKKDLEIALSQSVGGAGGTSVVTIYERG